jgi:urease accessory protein UreH
MDSPGVAVRNVDMRVALAEIGRRGRLDLTFVLQDGQTVLRKSYCEVPFKITRILNSRRSLAHLILMQCTAGLFGGDEVECSVRIERGARVLLTQQSATKVHPSRERPAIQMNHIVVESGAELQLYLEPVIPFAGSSLRQITRIDVESGARLRFWEGFMAGRVSRGECWQFRELASETHLRVNRELVYLDRFRLVPHGFAGSRWSTGDCSYFGTALYFGEQAHEFSARLHQELPKAGVDNLGTGLVLARIVSASGPEFHHCRTVFGEGGGVHT